jgi:hypothetical protein
MHAGKEEPNFHGAGDLPEKTACEPTIRMQPDRKVGDIPDPDTEVKFADGTKDPQPD